MKNSSTLTATGPVHGDSFEGQESSVKSQNERLMGWLDTGKRITGPIAARQLRIGYLPARVYDCRKRYQQMGKDIDNRWVKYTGATGEITKIKEYWLVDMNPRRQMELNMENE